MELTRQHQQHHLSRRQAASWHPAGVPAPSAQPRSPPAPRSPLGGASPTAPRASPAGARRPAARRRLAAPSPPRTPAPPRRAGRAARSQRRGAPFPGSAPPPRRAGSGGSAPAPRPSPGGPSGPLPPEGGSRARRRAPAELRQLPPQGVQRLDHVFALVHGDGPLLQGLPELALQTRPGRLSLGQPDARAPELLGAAARGRGGRKLRLEPPPAGPLLLELLQQELLSATPRRGYRPPRLRGRALGQAPLQARALLFQARALVLQLEAVLLRSLQRLRHALPAPRQGGVLAPEAREGVPRVLLPRAGRRPRGPRGPRGLALPRQRPLGLPRPRLGRPRPRL